MERERSVLLWCAALSLTGWMITRVFGGDEPGRTEARRGRKELVVRATTPEKPRLPMPPKPASPQASPKPPRDRTGSTSTSMDQERPFEVVPLERGFSGPKSRAAVVVDGEYAVIHGDILVGKASDLVGEKSGIAGGTRERKEQGKDADVEVENPKLWEGGILPYVVSAEIPNPERIHEAAEEISAFTNVKVVPRVLEDDYVVFKRGKACYSYVGRQGGPQDVVLADRCGKGSVIHEMMHVLGFFHEHSRPDRDDYIQIHYENIREGYGNQFAVLTAEYWQGLDAPFDYRSVMLYGFDAFAKHTAREIVENPSKATMTDLMGDLYQANRVGLSDGDVYRINTLYPLVYPE